MEEQQTPSGVLEHKKPLKKLLKMKKKKKDCHNIKGKQKSLVFNFLTLFPYSLFPS
jgi:hypothetical protein